MNHTGSSGYFLRVVSLGWTNGLIGSLGLWDVLRTYALGMLTYLIRIGGRLNRSMALGYLDGYGSRPVCTGLTLLQL